MKKNAIFVLGMHRSGTSALAGMLANLGVVMPKTLMVPQPENPKGYFESYAIMAVSDEILKAGNSSWDDWRPLHLPALADRFDDKIHKVIDEEFDGEPLISIKDPRHCRMVPIWTTGLSREGYEPLVIMPYRHAMEVAQSLKARGKMSLAQGLLLWLRHVLDAEFYTRDMPRAFVYMPDLLEDWQSCADNIAAKLNLVWPDSPDVAHDKVENHLDKDLKRHSFSEDMLSTDPLLRGWVKTVFRAIEGLKNELNIAQYQAELDDVRSQLDEAASLFGPAMLGLERQAEKVELENTTLTHETERLQGVAKEAQEAYHRLEEQVGGLRTDAQELRDHIEVLTAAHHGHVAEIEILKNEKLILHDQAVSQQNQIEMMTAAHHGHVAEIETLKTEKLTLHDQAVSQQNHIEVLTAAHHGHVAEIETLKNEKLILHDQAVSQQNQIEMITAAHHAHVAEIEALKTEKLTLHDRVLSQQNQLEIESLARKKHEDDLEKVRLEKQNLRDQGLALQHQIEMRSAEAARSTEEKRAVQHQFDALSVAYQTQAVSLIRHEAECRTMRDLVQAHETGLAHERQLAEDRQGAYEIALARMNENFDTQRAAFMAELAQLKAHSALLSETLSEKEKAQQKALTELQSQIWMLQADYHNAESALQRYRKAGRLSLLAWAIRSKSKP